MKKLCINLLTVLLFTSSFSFIYGQAKKEDYVKMKYTNTLLFVPGNDSIQAFYISHRPVTNRDYIIYLRWLENIYGVEFPHKVVKAFPGDLELSISSEEGYIILELIKMSESYVQDYIFNPNYLDSPVIGITWEQANEYCYWLSDRYNEYALITSKILYWDYYQMSPENFVMESYIAEQYIGMVKKPIIDKETGKERNANWEDGILVPSFRLPSKSEFSLVDCSNDLSGDIYVSGPYEYQFKKKDFILKWWEHLLIGITENKISFYYPYREETIILQTKEDSQELDWPGIAVLEWCLDSKMQQEFGDITNIYSNYGQTISNYKSIKEKVEGNEPSIQKNEYGQMPYRIIAANNEGPIIVDTDVEAKFPADSNYLYDLENNKVVSDRYNKVFTCFRYAVSAIKK